MQPDRESSFIETLLGIVKAVKDALTVRIDEIDARVKALRNGENGADGKDGKDGANGRDGRDIDETLLKQMLAREAARDSEIVMLKSALAAQQTLVIDDEGQLVVQANGGVKVLGRVRGKDGRDAVVPDVAEIARIAATLIPTPKDGRDAPPVDIDAIAEKAAALIPVPSDGRDAPHLTVHDVMPVVTAAVEQAVKALPAPKDGRDGTNGQSVEVEHVAAMVQKCVDAIPRPQDGRSVTVEDVSPLIAAEVTKAMTAMRVPADGVGVAGAVQDHAGNLILTLSNGSVANVGTVHGKDADPLDIKRQIAEAVAQIPIPKDGRDGVDGLGFDDWAVERDDEGRAFMALRNGDRAKRYRFPCEWDRGVYRESLQYYEGNGVTVDGSYWKAQQDLPPGKPGTPNSGWRLAVKRGADGKAVKGDRGMKGDRGPDSWGNG